MTGFGRFTARAGERALTVELKSVNHRYLDLSFRLPQALNFLESSLRAQLMQALSRGHVDVTLRFEGQSAQTGSVKVNIPLAQAYHEAYRQLGEAVPLRDPPGLRDLLTAPGVLTAQDPEEDEAALTDLAQQAMAQALNALVAAREREGQALKSQLMDCLASMRQLKEGMAAAAKDQPRQCRERLMERLNQLALEGLDPQRLAQEAALMADRCAVDEELTRLDAHLAQLSQLLDQQAPVGRKLDFLTQEIHRELNTIGSKSASIELTQLMLEGKNQLEKLREQAQNIE